MNNYQKLTATVLIVATIALMFGLHSMIHLDTAEATHSHWTCIFKRHDDYLTLLYSRTRYLSNYRTVITTCSACSGSSSPSSHQQQEAVTEYMKDVYWRHKYPLIGSWSFCHIHAAIVISTSAPYWVTLSCGGSD